MPIHKGWRKASTESDCTAVKTCVEHGCQLQDKSDDQKGGGGGMFKGLIDTIIGNLQLSISNIHVRYEVIYQPFGCIH